MARFAVILHEGSPAPREMRLGHILDFFGVPWKTIAVSELGKLDSGSLEYAALGSVGAVAAAFDQNLRIGCAIPPFAAVYTYLDEDRRRSERHLQALCGRTDLALLQAPAQELPVAVSDTLPDLTGPMSGLDLRLRMGEEGAFLVGAVPGAKSGSETILSAGDSPVFLRFRNHGADIFLCASSRMVDINQPVGGGFYDVKEHFRSVVPLVMFIRSVFPEVAWRPQELGACLIVDDPLLKPRYGFCDFPKLQVLMQGHGFHTNIAFIPWNWRPQLPPQNSSRTSRSFFRSPYMDVTILGVSLEPPPSTS